MLQAGLLGEGNGAPPRDPATMELLFDSLRRGVDFRHAPRGPLTLQWDFPDAEPWHLRVDNGSTAVAPGFVDGADVTFRVRYDDFVDVFAGRLDARPGDADAASCARAGRSRRSGARAGCSAKPERPR